MSKQPQEFKQLFQYIYSITKLVHSKLYKTMFRDKTFLITECFSKGHFPYKITLIVLYLLYILEISLGNFYIV